MFHPTKQADLRFHPDIGYFFRQRFSFSLETFRVKMRKVPGSPTPTLLKAWSCKLDPEPSPWPRLDPAAPAQCPPCLSPVSLSISPSLPPSLQESGSSGGFCLLRESLSSPESAWCFALEPVSLSLFKRVKCLEMPVETTFLFQH